jgi:hypothetical protein
MPSVSGQTYTFTVTDAAFVAVKAQSYCRRITIREEPPDAPTTNYLIAKPASTDQQITRIQGTGYAFEVPGRRNYFAPNETVGYVKLAAAGGSKTFQQDEEP